MISYSFPRLGGGIPANLVLPVIGERAGRDDAIADPVEIAAENTHALSVGACNQNLHTLAMRTAFATHGCYPWWLQGRMPDGRATKNPAISGAFV